MLDLASMDPEFWQLAHALRASLIYAGRTDEAISGYHWNPGPRRAYVYILTSGPVVVYIGKSFNPHQRFKKHQRRDWWAGTEHVVVLQVVGSSRDDAGRKALCLEGAAIRHATPLVNIVGVVR